MSKALKHSLEMKIGYPFNDAQLMITAFTHSSYANEHSGESNERLEFLGDSILNFAVTQFMYNHYPDKDEGVFSKVRSRIVSTETISQIVEEKQLHLYLLLGSSEHKASKMSKKKMHANLFEAIVGAVFLDGGLEKAIKFVLEYLADKIELFINSDLISDYKTALQELIQKRKGDTLKYVLVCKDGPDHSPEFTYAAEINGEIYGVGKGSSKSSAQLEASKIAYEKWNEKLTADHQ